MRRTRLLAAVAVVAIPACHSSLAPEKQLTLTLQASQTHVAQNETVSLLATVINESDQTMSFVTACGRIITIEVANAADSVVFTLPSADAGCASGTTTLKSGQSEQALLETTGFTDGSVALPPGNYYLRTLVRPNGVAQRSPNAVVTVTSATAT